ncbi:MAG: bifunctional phosphopantothenoylcysteine decarboxylase/phosphopantothenate--cysteine ligase CoaBC [Chloroflexota bacterium]
MISILKDKKIVIGVTGSIACYKVVDLASKLTQAGALVDVILTEAAQQFVTTLTFRSVTGRPVFNDMWDLDEHVRHVGLGETADLMMIAPATAHTIAKLAHGLADNLLTVTALAARCPLLVAPAMDGGMYENPATLANVTLLKSRGVRFAGPTTGRMASGLSGLGRMLEPAELFAYVRLGVAQQVGELVGKKVVVTAGPTREALDPVRFISNRSTGKQGFAVAQAALDAGADVTLIHGPVNLSVPIGATAVPVTTTQEMADATITAVEDIDALFMVAAVADFRPETKSDQKIKKTDEQWGMAIALEKTLDILSSVKAKREKTGSPKVVLGFAAETQDAFTYGRSKLLRKGLNFIAVNDVTAQGGGFEVDTNRIVLLSSAGVVDEMPLLSKTAVAERLVHHVAQAIGE